MELVCKHSFALTQEFLQSRGASAELMDQVVSIISCVGFKDELANGAGRQLSIEAQVVQDADRWGLVHWSLARTSWACHWIDKNNSRIRIISYKKSRITECDTSLVIAGDSLSHGCISACTCHSVPLSDHGAVISCNLLNGQKILLVLCSCVPHVSFQLNACLQLHSHARSKWLATCSA